LSFGYDLVNDTPDLVANELKKDIGNINEVDILRIKNDIRMIVENIRAKTSIDNQNDESAHFKE
jgi:hypothetical protein